MTASSILLVVGIALAASVPAAPVAKITGLRADAVMHRVALTFENTSVVPATRYDCAWGRPGRTEWFRSCSSPRYYIGVLPGTYVFEVRALGPYGQEPQAARRGLKVPIEFSRCWGAASHDPAAPCHNAALSRVIDPTPETGFVHEGYCDDLRLELNVPVCDFGDEAASAGSGVALIGDSHAGALRRAIEYVAVTKGWHGYYLNRNGCGFSTAYMKYVPQSISDSCHTWSQQVVSWLDAHPSVHTAIITVADYWSYATDPAAGYDQIWADLPASVKTIYVIRDNPDFTTGEVNCVNQAVAHHSDGGAPCARPRSVVLLADPEAAAAADSGSARVHLIDLTPFYCDASQCLPVIGGVLVLSDLVHVSQEFAQTLGPYILRAIDS